MKLFHSNTLEHLFVLSRFIGGGGSCPDQALLNEAAALSLVSLIIPNQSSANTRHAADASKH